MFIVNSTEKETASIYSILDSIISLISGDNKIDQKRIEKLFEKKCDRIEIFDEPKETVGELVAGITHHHTDIKKLVNFKRDYTNSSYTYIYKNDCNSKRDLEIHYHTIAHEIVHHMTTIVPILYKKVFLIEVKKQSMYYCDSGTVAKRDFNTFRDKTHIYGNMYNEVLTDLIAYIAVTYNSNLIDSDKINANDVLSKNDMIDNISSYQYCAPFVRLALAAFSNDPNEDFDELIKTNKSIFLNKKKINHFKSLYSNDLLFGFMYYPLHIKHKFDEIQGTDSYDKFMDLTDSIFSNIIKYYQLPKKESLEYLKILTEFVNNKTKLYIKNGYFTKKEAELYNKKYLLLSDSFLKILEIDDKKRKKREKELYNHVMKYINEHY